MKQSKPAVRERAVLVCPHSHKIVDTHIEGVGLGLFHIAVWLLCSDGDWFRYVRVGDKYLEGVRMAGGPSEPMVLRWSIYSRDRLVR